MANTQNRWELGREYPPIGEAADIDKVLTTLGGDFNKSFPQGGKAQARRDQHPKAHGCVRATFTVSAEIPKELRHGLFREPKSYNAWIRFSSSSPLMSPDTQKDAHGMAIKLMGVPGAKVLESERDAQTQDFITANANAFFVRSARDYVQFADAFSKGRILSFVFGWNPFRWRMHELFNMLRATKKTVTNPLQTRYWSQTPARLGRHAVKYSVKPQSSAVDPMPAAPGPDFLREAMVRTLGKGDVVFDFMVQLQTDPVRMPVEDSTIVWDETVSPFRKVAVIRIPAQEFDTPARNAFAENLSFTPWHSLPEHMPLGTTNRTRRRVYEMISTLRHARNGVPREEPMDDAALV